MCHFIKPLKKLFLFIFIYLLASVIPASGYEWGVVSDYEWNMAPPPDYPEANAVVIIDSCYLEFLTDEWEYKLEIGTRRFVREKVLTKAGADEIGQVEIPFHKTERLENVKAHTLYPDGSVYEVSDEDFYTKEIEDWRYLSFTFPQLDSGVIIEYSYACFDDAFWGSSSWDFQSGIYTLESVYSLEVGGGFEYNYVCNNMPESKKVPVKQENYRARQSRKNTIYTWRLKNLMPVKREPFMSCINDYIASISFNLTKYKGHIWTTEGVSSWKELGEAYERNLSAYGKKPRGFRKTVKDIVAGYATNYEKSQAIYSYVVNNIQTRQNKFTIRKSHDKLSELCEKKYGTSCEKNILLTEMLRQSGIDAWPVLIVTRDRGHINLEHLDINQFNHMLVFAEVEQGGIYLDATSKYCPYGVLPPVCRTNIGLIIDEDKSELIKIITAQPKSQRVEMTRISIDDRGKADFSTDSKFCGYLAADYGMRYEQNEPDDFIRDDYLENPDFLYNIGEYQCEMDSSNRFTVELNLSADNYAVRLDSTLSVDLPCFMFAENPFTDERRQFPVDFNYPFCYHSIVNIDLADSISSCTLPEDVIYVIDGASYKRQSRLTPFGATVERKFEIERPIYNVEEYPDVKEFFKVIADANREPLLFHTRSL